MGKTSKHSSKYFIKIYFFIPLLFNVLFSYCATIGVDIQNVDLPQNNWIVLANGSWNEWSWGVQLTDEDGNGIYEGEICDLNSGEYQYVYTITGDFDNWSGWGMVGNAPIGSQCDYNPGDQWLNYGFNIGNQDVVTEFNVWGECGLDGPDEQNSIYFSNNVSILCSLYAILSAYWY